MSPLPHSQKIGTIMEELKTGKKRPFKQRVAISLSHARKMGANIPKNPLQNEIQRRSGKPRTEVERIKRHKAKFGTSALPPRGTGLGLR